MEDNKRVLLTVVNDTGDEKIEQSYLADRYARGSHDYYRYREQAELGDTSTLLKIGVNEIRIIRQGDMASEQAFAEGELRTGYYRTAQGKLSLSTRTSRMSVRLVDGVGEVEWDYELELAGDPAGVYRLALQIRNLDEAE
jgi:uncharacterized beta-barrel protein YwiB (DUF1934 family)